MSQGKVTPIARPRTPPFDHGYSFIDKITIWLRDPLSKEGVQDLRQRCDAGKLHVSSKKPFPRWGYEQRLQICQPTREVLEMFAKRNDVFLNYLELAIDFGCNSEDDLDAAYDFLSHHIVKSHHGKQKVKCVGNRRRGTLYWALRNSGNVLVLYADRPSKVTGEVFNAHVEWRIKGSPALKRQKLESLIDLLNLDVRQFWAKRLSLQKVSLVKLGRAQQNFQRKTNRRGDWIIKRGRFAYDIDYRTGCTLMHTFGSVQSLIDEWKWINVRRCLTPIAVESLCQRRFKQWSMQEICL